MMSHVNLKSCSNFNSLYDSNKKEILDIALENKKMSDMIKGLLNEDYYKIKTDLEKKNDLLSQKNLNSRLTKKKLNYYNNQQNNNIIQSSNFKTINFKESNISNNNNNNLNEKINYFLNEINNDNELKCKYNKEFLWKEEIFELYNKGNKDLIIQKLMKMILNKEKENTNIFNKKNKLTENKKNLKKKLKKKTQKKTNKNQPKEKINYDNNEASKISEMIKNIKYRYNY